MEENESPQTNEAGYTINTISTETTVTGDSGFHFKIKIEGIETKALTDTGTNMTIISKQFFDKIKNKTPNINIEKIEITARNASGDVIKNHGRAMLEWKIDRFKGATPFFVMDIEKDIILGLEFMQKHQVNLDIAHLKMSIGGAKVNVISAEDKSDKNLQEEQDYYEVEMIIDKKWDAEHERDLY